MKEYFSKGTAFRYANPDGTQEVATFIRAAKEHQTTVAAKQRQDSIIGKREECQEAFYKRDELAVKHDSFG